MIPAWRTPFDEPPQEPSSKAPGATRELGDERCLPDRPHPAPLGPIGRLAACIAAAAWLALILAIGSAILLGAAIAALPLGLWALWKNRRVWQ